MNWYLGVLKNYTGFSGRARRTEYWMFALFQLIAVIILVVLAVVVKALIVLYALYALGTLLPGLAVLFRRLHDQNKSAAWIFIALVPIVGGIWLLVLTCLPGTIGPNNYGPNPKAAVAV